MQLPLTSLIPSVVELIAFWSNHFPDIWWFPNWYMGVPFRFVSGPIIPAFITSAHLLTRVSFEHLYIYFVCLTWGFGGVGVKFLVRVLGGGKQVQRWSMVLFWLLPIHLFLLQFGSGLHHISTALLPWVFLCWWKCLHSLMSSRPSLKGVWRDLLRMQDSSSDKLRDSSLTLGMTFWTLLTIVGSLIALLINYSALLPLFIGLTVLVLLKKRETWTVNGLKALFTILTSLSLATIWYTPRFWWILLGNPSFGGQPLSNVIPYILQLAQALLPIIVGIWVVQKRYRFAHKLTQFGILFGGSFLFLSIIRLLFDIDFWMDWVGFGLELQLGLSLLGGIFVYRYFKIRIFIVLLLGILTIINGFLVTSNFFDSKSFQYKEQVIDLFGDRLKQNERVFVTGSPVFWLGSTKQNSFLQTRGGHDEASTHQTWAMGSFAIREGEDTELLSHWLNIFGVSTFLYQSETSQEYFRDYKNSDRFMNFTDLAELNGDVLYDGRGSVARSASAELLEVDEPKKGDDKIALERYSDNLYDTLEFSYNLPTQIQVRGNVEKEDIISLAITFDSNWKLTEGEGRLVSDNFGNMAIVPNQKESKWVLEYQDTWGSTLPGIILSVVFIMLLTQSDRLVHLLVRKAPSLTDRDINEEVEY